jgi:hypothetical protein
MFNDWRNIFVVFILVVLISPVLGGASCNTNSVLDTIRDVHTGVREAGRLADEQIGPHLENHGDVCMERSTAAGVGQDSEDAGMEFWQDCMAAYMQLDVAVTGFRSALEELENVYQDIEAGTRGETDWRYWAARALDHGRTIIRFVRELDVGIDSDVLRGLQSNLDSLCGMLGCDEEATS